MERVTGRWRMPPRCDRTDSATLLDDRQIVNQRRLEQSAGTRYDRWPFPLQRSSMARVDIKDDLAQAFVTTEAFRYDAEKGFRLASGAVSPFYVDCRILMAHPRPRRLVAELACQALAEVPGDCLGGLEIGAISISTAISDFAMGARPAREWRTFVVRKQAKDHGLGKVIEGAARAGDRAILVDDVLTSGGSILRALHAARDYGLVVSHALVIVDRKEQNGRSRVEQEGIRLISLLTIDDLTSHVPTSQRG